MQQQEPQSPRLFFNSAFSSTPTAASHRRIAIAVDLSDESAYAVKWAVQNYLRQGDAVILLHVRPTSVLYGADWGGVGDDDQDQESQPKSEDDFDNFTTTKAQDLAQPLVYSKIPFKIHIVKDHDMKERLCLEVERLGLSAVIMGSRGFGASRTNSKGRLGSVSDYCVHHCVCPVVVVRYPDELPAGPMLVEEEKKEADVEVKPVPEEEVEYHDACVEQKGKYHERVCFLDRVSDNNHKMQANGKSARLPRKRFYRARAHSNPLSDSHFPIPISPSDVDYSQHFPHFFPCGKKDDDKNGTSLPKIRFADIGCGFGGLLVSLSTLFPDTLMIGMELRDKVTEYVKERILALRAANPGQYENISVVRTNSMKYLPNHFGKAQLSKMFFLFPDPHFKEKNHRRRVISPQLLDEYGYALEVGGIIYTITDVEELGDWMRSCMEDHPLFEPVPNKELEADPVVKLLTSATEEGQKVARNGGQTFRAIFRRIAVVEDD